MLYDQPTPIRSASMISPTLDPMCDRCQHRSSYHHLHGCGACHYRECACAQLALALAPAELALAA